VGEGGLVKVFVTVVVIAERVAVVVTIPMQPVVELE